MPKRIFWVEDNPVSIDQAFKAVRELRDYNIADIFGKTTFAFGYDHAQELYRGDWDLIVLDADFPKVVKRSRIPMLEEQVRRIIQGEEVDAREFVSGRKLPRMSPGYVYGNEFYRLKTDVIGDTITPVVVFSQSSLAAGVARELDLPFFTKSPFPSDQNNIPRDVARYFRFEGKEPPSIEGWEYGTAKDFVERYLAE